MTKSVFSGFFWCLKTENTDFIGVWYKISIKIAIYLDQLEYLLSYMLQNIHLRLLNSSKCDTNQKLNILFNCKGVHCNKHTFTTPFCISNGGCVISSKPTLFLGFLNFFLQISTFSLSSIEDLLKLFKKFDFFYSFQDFISTMYGRKLRHCDNEYFRAVEYRKKIRSIKLFLTS